MLLMRMIRMTLRHHTSRLPGKERVQPAVQIVQISSLSKDASQVPRISLPLIPIDSINYQIPSERRKGWIDGAMQGFKEHLTIYEESQRPFIPPPNVSEEEAMNLRHDHEQQAIIGPKEAENHFKGMFVISRKYARKTELFTTMKESVTNNPVHLATFEKWYKEMQSTYDGCA
jgi:hypothetical protein